jgi:transcription initiation factor IIE alpha subunit
MSSRKGQHKMLANASALLELCRLLNDSEYTKAQLAEQTGLVLGTVIKWMRILLNKKLIYIVDWVPPSGSGQYAAVWAWGYEQDDAPKPKARTQSEYSAKYRQRKIEKAALHGIKG